MSHLWSLEEATMHMWESLLEAARRAVALTEGRSFTLTLLFRWVDGSLVLFAVTASGHRAAAQGFHAAVHAGRIRPAHAGVYSSSSLLDALMYRLGYEYTRKQFHKTAYAFLAQITYGHGRNRAAGLDRRDACVCMD
jgi:hypothetical protein